MGKYPYSQSLGQVGFMTYGLMKFYPINYHAHSGYLGRDTDGEPHWAIRIKCPIDNEHMVYEIGL